MAFGAKHSVQYGLFTAQPPQLWSKLPLCVCEDGPISEFHILWQHPKLHFLLLWRVSWPSFAEGLASIGEVNCWNRQTPYSPFLSRSIFANTKGVRMMSKGTYIWDRALLGHGLSSIPRQGWTGLEDRSDFGNLISSGHFESLTTLS